MVYICCHLVDLLSIIILRFPLSNLKILLHISKITSIQTPIKKASQNAQPKTGARENVRQVEVVVPRISF